MFFEGETKQRSNFFKNGFSFTFNTTFNHSFIQEGAFVGLTVEQCCRLIKKRKEITMILCTATLCTYVQVRSKQGGGNQPPPPVAESLPRRLRLLRLQPFLPSASRNCSIIAHPPGGRARGRRLPLPACRPPATRPARPARLRSRRHHRCPGRRRRPRGCSCRPV